MLTESLNAYNDSKYANLKEELKFAAAYFLTGAKLIDEDLEGIVVPEEIAVLSDDEIKLIDEAFTRSGRLFPIYAR